MKKTILFLIILLNVQVSYCQTTPFQKKFAPIDRYIDSLMKDWNIPGLALGIVYKDQLIYAKGYGYRDLENKLPVQSTTLFPIGSNTKLFTSTVACILVEEGKLSLDKPARNFLPALKFYNDELDSKVTLRDMLSHRTGLPRYDGIWVASTYNRKELVNSIAYMQPQLGFREGYIYNNMMYLAAGAVLENVSGMSWEELVRTKIFRTLGMDASCFADEEMTKSGNFSYSYFEPDSTRRLQKTNFIALNPSLGPAGTIRSNIEDMGRWMIVQLNKGSLKGHQLIPAAAIEKTLVPNNIADKEGKWEELSNALYGLGRNIMTYKGYKIATHTGSIDGFHSNMTIIPSQQLAIFIVHNSSPAGSLRPGMAFPVIDRLLELSATPWSERYLAEDRKSKAETKKAKDSVLATRVKSTSSSHAMEAYVGKFTNALYGEISIEQQNQQLWIAYRGQRLALQHFHFDQFITDEEAKGKRDFRINFITDSKGGISRLSTKIFGDSDAEFVRK